MTRYVVAPNGVPSPLLTHMMNKRIEEERKAPCARHCEAKAFEIELRQKDARITELEAQNAKLVEALKDTLEMLEVYCGEYEQSTRNRARAALAQGDKT